MTHLDPQRQSERQRRKEEAIALAMAHAAMRGETLRVVATDEATAKRVFAEAKRQLKREPPSSEED